MSDMLLDELFDPRPSEDTSLACDPSAHSEAELKQHAEKVEGLLAEREEMRKVSGGYAFRYPGTMAYAERILDFIRLERKCCPFLSFEIAFEPEKRGIWLYVGGDEQVEEYLSQKADSLTP